MKGKDYILPDVWHWQPKEAGIWGTINRPTSGATHTRTLPCGQHPFQLYSMGTPNGQKVTILLEELLMLGIKEAEYDAWLIKIQEGEQFGSGFVDLNPNSKIPALLDTTITPPLRLFESGSILLYLANKFGRFIPDEPPGRTEVINWLFWLQGAAPYIGGGFGHFYHYAPVKIEYAVDRFTMETKRLLDVLDKQLERHRYVAGETYSIADMASWPWFGGLVLDTSYKAAAFLDIDQYPHVQRWTQEIAERPAVKRGCIINRTTGEPHLKERHSAQDIDRLLGN